MEHAYETVECAYEIISDATLPPQFADSGTISSLPVNQMTASSLNGSHSTRFHGFFTLWMHLFDHLHLSVCFVVSEFVICVIITVIHFMLHSKLSTLLKHVLKLPFDPGSQSFPKS